MPTGRDRKRRVYANRLNELTGKDWIKFTKSWFIHRPERRSDRKLLHPASYPESLVREFIQFFTRPGQIVVDPFLGTGSTLIAAVGAGRSGVGFEIVPKYAKISQRRLKDSLVENHAPEDFKNRRKLFADVVSADSIMMSKIWHEKRLPPADYCITSPPYWNQLKRNSIRQKTRVERGLDTKYST